MDSSTALRTSSASSSSSSSSTGPPFSVGRKVELCMPGKGCATVVFAPDLPTLWSRREGMGARRGDAGANDCRWEVVSGVRMVKNLGRWAWESDGRLSSIGYTGDKDWATWC